MNSSSGREASPGPARSRLRCGTGSDTTRPDEIQAMAVAAFVVPTLPSPHPSVGDHLLRPGFGTCSGAYGRCSSPAPSPSSRPGAGDNEERTTFNKRTSRQLRRGKMSSGNEKLSSGVVDLPPGDAIVANSKKSETLGNGKIEIDSGDASNVLQCVYDIFNGVIVDPDCLPPDVPTFGTCLTTSIALWKQQERHGIWLKIPIEKVNLIEPAVKAGFIFHHAESEYLMLTLWLPDEPCTLPPNASHQVGIGAFLLNDKNEVLAVQEKNGPLKGTGIWKWPTGLINQGEDIVTGAIREVKEETGVDAEFVECVGFRQGHGGLFGKSDLFFVCILRPLSTQIVKQDSEIAAAQWMPLSELQAQPFYTERPIARISLEVCIAHAKGNYKGFVPHDNVREGSEGLPQYFYYNPVSMSMLHS